MKTRDSFWPLCFCFAGLIGCTTQFGASAASGVPSVAEPAPIPVSPTDTLASTRAVRVTRVTFMNLDTLYPPIIQK
ncbi:exported hypothetical protein [Gammaproteobacteria bacterium]